MKKYSFALLVLAVTAITFAFTPTPSPKKSPTSTVYAFNSAGTLIGSASDTMTLKSTLCPGANQVFCAQVWTSKTPQNRPAGTQLDDILKPAP